MEKRVKKRVGKMGKKLSKISKAAIPSARVKKKKKNPFKKGEKVSTLHHFSTNTRKKEKEKPKHYNITFYNIIHSFIHGEHHHSPPSL